MAPDTIEPDLRGRKRRKPKRPEPLYGLKPAVVEAVAAAARDGDAKRIRRLIYPLHYTDVADLLERLNGSERRVVIDATQRTLAPEALTELDDALREDVVRQLETRRLAVAMSELDTDDAVSLIEDLDADRVQEILEAVDRQDRELIEEGLSYPEDSAGRLMQREFVHVPQSWTVGEVIDFMRESEDLPDDFYDLFLTDRRRRPIGHVPLNKLLRSRRATRIKQLMDDQIATIPVTMDQEDVARLFRDRDLVSAPVVDGDGRLVGMITVDDVVDVIEEEAEEDLLRLGGVAESDVFRPAWSTAYRRTRWLLITLVNTILASVVISQFEGTIERLVALAVLMPIVAAMGGNAGMQVVTVTVRALATRDLHSANVRRAIGKELLVGIINGFVFATIMGTIAAVWFNFPQLGLVLFGAMLFNMLWAGLAGTLIPLALHRFGVDPAIAAGPFLTTTTDVFGFFVFLGFATLFLF